MTRKTGKKAFAVTMIFLLCFTLGGLRFVYAQTTSDVQNDLDDVKNQQKETSQKLDQVEKDIKGLQAQVEQMNAQINQTTAQITKIEKKINAKEAEMQDQENNLNKRLRVMYKNGSAGFFDVLLGSSSISEFVSNVEMIQKIYENDVDVMETLEKECKALEASKAELKEKQTELDRQKADLAIQQASLDEKKKILEEKEDELEKQAKELTNTLKAMIDANSEYVGGVFMWPCPSSHYITSYAGYRMHPVLHVWKYHSGMDIAASTGSDILAAGDGKVILSQVYGGYGNCVIIDHGGGVTTIYGHCSQLLVSVGDVVKKGDLIAKVGSTGISSGPHLHFEVRVNGEIKDPLDYLKG